MTTHPASTRRHDAQLAAHLVAFVEPHVGDMLSFGAYGEGPSGTVSADAPAQTRLLDWFGRRP